MTRDRKKTEGIYYINTYFI